MRVILEIFSGRENPEFALTDTETSRVEALIAGFHSFHGDESEPPPLGYRGFVLTGCDSRIGEEIRVFRATVSVLRGGSWVRLRDSERLLERVLVQAAREHVGEVLPYDWIEDSGTDA